MSRYALATLVLLGSCSSLTQTPGTPSAKSEGSEAGFMNPVTQPTIFESPTIQREVRPIIIHQRMPENSIFSGGDFQVYALQLRVPLTDRLALIATKDGYVDFNPDSNPVTGRDEGGFADIGGGLKYALIQGDKLTVTPGLIFETYSGEHEVFQGNGDGLFRPFVSVGFNLTKKINFLGNLGANVPSNGSAETQSVDYHLHLDMALTDRITPLVEINGITYTANAKAIGVNFEGGDLINLGATGVAGQTVISGALGLRFKLSNTMNVGMAYEAPLTNRKDLLKDRFTFDLTMIF